MALNSQAKDFYLDYEGYARLTLSVGIPEAARHAHHIRHPPGEPAPSPSATHIPYLTNRSDKDTRICVQDRYLYRKESQHSEA